LSLPIGGSHIFSPPQCEAVHRCAKFLEAKAEEGRRSLRAGEGIALRCPLGEEADGSSKRAVNEETPREAGRLLRGRIDTSAPRVRTSPADMSRAILHPRRPPVCSIHDSQCPALPLAWLLARGASVGSSSPGHCRDTKQLWSAKSLIHGAPDKIRTCDLCLRSAPVYSSYEIGGTRTRSKPVPRVPLFDLEKNWRRKESKLAYSVQAIDLIGAP
jgi:hypothetical protein